MQPITFPQANKTLGKPAGWTDEQCAPLPVYNNGEVSFSCWKMTWRERFSALFFGVVWLEVHYGKTQPPVALAASRKYFLEENKAVEFLRVIREKLGYKK